MRLSKGLMIRSVVPAAWKAAATAVLAASVLLSIGAADAHAANWQLYDKGEHLLLPEGPIEQDGVVMVPLRPIAERFGYHFDSISGSEVALSGGVIGEVLLKPGSTAAIYNGSVTKQMKKAPAYINGILFVSLDFAGELTDIGYSVVPGTSLIQFRPAEGDALTRLNEQYWRQVKTASGFDFINNKGETRLSVKASGLGYIRAADFGYEALAPVRTSMNAGFDYIDREGQTVFEADHYGVGGFNEGVAVFKEWTHPNYPVKFGYLNRTGRTIIPAVFDKAWDFSDGLAKVVLNNKTFYIDHTGRTAIAPISGSTHTQPFSEGLAAVSVRQKAGGKLVEKTGFINTKGQFAIKPSFDYAGAFSDGLATATVGKKTGYIDKTGRWAIQPRYENGFAGNFRNGYAVITLREGQSYRQELIDKKGKAVKLPAGIKRIGEYSEGLIAFEQNGLWGYMSLDGKTVIEPRFLWAVSFQAGAAWVELDSAKPGVSYTALIDKKGNVLWRSDAQ